MNLSTADLLDANEALLGDGRLRVATPLFKCYGGRPRFAGRIATLRTFEDNSKVREALAEPGAGRVLVVDGAGSLRCALLGDQLALLAQGNGWEGVVINGCLRDSVAIAGMAIGVRALATHPQKSVKRGLGERDVALAFAGVAFLPGDWLCADEDGVIVCSDALA
jgi:regulator of ribonuclease activity A